jgi:hypothetical protein
MVMPHGQGFAAISSASFRYEILRTKKSPVFTPGLGMILDRTGGSSIQNPKKIVPFKPTEYTLLPANVGGDVWIDFYSSCIPERVLLFVLSRYRFSSCLSGIFTLIERAREFAE